MMILIVFIVFLALLFDFINGMNDAANSVATVISTRVLTPRQAVLWAAFFNFAAAFVASSAGVNVMRDQRARLNSRPPSLAMVELTAIMSPASTT